jgi:hypothetical protein
VAGQPLDLGERVLQLQVALRQLAAQLADLRADRGQPERAQEEEEPQHRDVGRRAAGPGEAFVHQPQRERAGRARQQPRDREPACVEGDQRVGEADQQRRQNSTASCGAASRKPSCTRQPTASCSPSMPGSARRRFQPSRIASQNAKLAAIETARKASTTPRHAAGHAYSASTSACSA